MDERSYRLLMMIMLTLLALASIAAGGEGAPGSLYSDKRALKQNDVVTILLMEYTQGSNSANTDGETRHDLQVTSSSSGLLDFIPGLGLDSKIDSDQRARGATSRQGTLRGKMSAQIVDILPNGNLKIEGKRTVEINGEEQTTILTGVVRPRDILSDNTVYSYLIADASISYRGRGMVNDAAKTGILSRFINWLF